MLARKIILRVPSSSVRAGSSAIMLSPYHFCLGSTRHSFIPGPHLASAPCTVHFSVSSTPIACTFVSRPPGTLQWGHWWKCLGVGGTRRGGTPLSGCVADVDCAPEGEEKEAIFVSRTRSKRIKGKRPPPPCIRRQDGSGRTYRCCWPGPSGNALAQARCTRRGSSYIRAAIAI